MAYFPNGSAGEVLVEQCCDCPLGWGWLDEAEELERQPRFCPTQAVQSDSNYDQLKAGNEKLREAMNILINEDGECQTRKALVEIRKKS